MEDAHHNKSAISYAKFVLLSTFKDKIEIPKFPGKPPRIKGLTLFPIREKDHPVALLPASASAQDLRSIEDVEKETVKAVEAVEAAASPRDAHEETSPRGSDSETSSSKASTSSTDGNHIRNSASLWKGFFKPSWKQFTTAELQRATDNFNQENLIGKGGFSEVYEGCLEDGQFVAVKRLTTGTVEERTNNFLAELGILVHINHPNIAKLIGVGVEDDMHLVLRLSPNGSLSTLLHGSKGKLEWDVRYKIAIGTAEGLEYLHERCQRRIIHRDIKTANILLTEDFEPQIADFGLAKWLPDQLTHHTMSSFEGTFGYLAPEYLTHGVVDEKTDVFAFGVLLLELISGRKALDSSQHSLLMWAKPLIERGEIKRLVDPKLGDSYDCEQLRRVTEVASLCIQHSSMLRPKMSEVIPMLRGEEEGRAEAAKMYQIPLRRRTYSEELFDAEEYNATKYLNDLNRHKQIALDFRAGE